MAVYKYKFQIASFLLSRLNKLYIYRLVAPTAGCHLKGCDAGSCNFNFKQFFSKTYIITFKDYEVK